MNKEPERVSVEFKMRRDRTSENEFWMKVVATKVDEDVEKIKIELYQTEDDAPGEMHLYGASLAPYPLQSGKLLTWDFAINHVVAVIISYQLAGPEYEDYRWHVAASGIWKCADGSYFESGKRLRDTSELFNG